MLVFCCPSFSLVVLKGRFFIVLILGGRQRVNIKPESAEPCGKLLPMVKLGVLEPFIFIFIVEYSL